MSSSLSSLLLRRILQAAGVLTLACAALAGLHAQVPQLVSYQGRVAVEGVNFDGPGSFKFALVNPDGSVTYWSNDGTSDAGNEPTAAVSLTVTQGLYAVLLGDTSLNNMTAIPASVWTNPDVRLRVWFDDGVNGSQLLAPDQRLAPTGYLADGAVGNSQLAAGAVGSAQIADGAVGSDQLASNLSLGGNLTLSATTDSSGAIYFGDDTLLHAFGTQNVFVGGGAGNFTMTGVDNTALGYQTLVSNSEGDFNTAVGFEALYSNTSGLYNVAVGYEALVSNTGGFSNTALGAAAMLANTTGYNNSAWSDNALTANISGHDNTAGGYASLYLNKTGNFNTALGGAALYSNNTDNNTAIGYSALYSNVIGINNTAIGLQALYSNTAGSDNLASGVNALYANTFGFFNTACGYGALVANTTGNDNAACGYNALKVNLNGNGNTACGDSALSGVTNGSYNIGLGNNGGSGITSGVYNIDIANAGLAGDTNTIRIGDENIHSAAFIAGIWGPNVGANGLPVYINSAGQLGTNATSSRRFKQDIADMAGASDILLAMRPVSFRYRPEIEPKGSPQFGLIAEEVAELNPNLVVRDAKGEIFSVRYDAVNAMLLNEFLKDHHRAETRDAEFAKLREENAAVKKQLAELQAKDQEREARLSRLENLLPEHYPGSGKNGCQPQQPLRL